MSINKAENIINKTNDNLIIGGLDSNLVINKNYLNSLGDICKCCLCQKIMFNPVECEQCGHNFCYTCLSTSGCPFGCSHLKINKASLSIINILNNIKFECANVGCTEILYYSEVETHIRDCPYQKIKCENDGCDKIILKKDIFEHNKNECHYFKIKCKWCKNAFIKRDIDKHEKECELIPKEKENANYINDKIGLEEHLQRLSKNLNEIINDNKKLVEEFNKNNENSYPARISIRKSMIGGLEEDEFSNMIKEELEIKIKKYYTDFNNNYEKLLEEIEEIKPILNEYIEENKTKEKEMKLKKEKEKEEIITFDNITKDLTNELKNTMDKYNEKFISEFKAINNLFEKKSKNINKSHKHKKDMYSLINIMFNNLGKYLFDTNNKINSLSNNFFQQFNNLISSCNKNIALNKPKNDKENINQANKENNLENKKVLLKNVNEELTELKNDIKKSINLINEKFVDFSDLINYNNLKNTSKLNYEVCPISSFSLIHFQIPDIENNNYLNVINSNEQVDISKNYYFELDDLNNLDTKLTELENNTKKFYSKIKEKLKSEISIKLNEINIDIEKDIDSKIDLMFDSKQCNLCEKIDYNYGFINCNICTENICKQCVILCTKCKKFSCYKCGLCKKCGKNICKNCRILCISCNEYYCDSCISKCPVCNINICSNCLLIKCSICNNNNFCANCGQKCQICEKNFCSNCIKNINFSSCYLCKKNSCEICHKKCNENDKIICNKCSNECSNCKNFCCNENMIICKKCGKKLCIKCGEESIKNYNCKFCKNIFCKDCFNVNMNNITKCFSCNKKHCIICLSKCNNCSNDFCKECSNICKNCGKFSCIRCTYECICEKTFCLKCINKNEIIFPHDCIYFLNNCAITDSKKIHSLKKIPNNLNIEAKFSCLMTDISDKSFLLIGLIDNELDGNIFTINVNNGNKFSTKKGFESFLDFEDVNKGINYVYVMIKENKLFFKINESIYKYAYDLDKKSNFWLYIENNINGSATKFLYIRKIK